MGEGVTGWIEASGAEGPSEKHEASEMQPPHPGVCRSQLEFIFSQIDEKFHSSEELWVIFVAFSVAFPFFYTMLILFFRSKVHKIKG